MTAAEPLGIDGLVAPEKFRTGTFVSAHPVRAAGHTRRSQMPAHTAPSGLAPAHRISRARRGSCRPALHNAWREWYGPLGAAAVARFRRPGKARRSHRPHLLGSATPSAREHKG